MTFTRVESEGQKERAKGRGVLRLLKLDSEVYTRYGYESQF